MVCWPLSRGRCGNLRADTTGGITVTVDIGDCLTTHSAAKNSIPLQGWDDNRVCNDSQPVNNEGGIDDPFLKEKFARAFGVPLLNSAGGDDALDVCSLWCGTVSLKGRQYVLPNGGVGTRFVHMLSEVIERCNEGRQRSQWEFAFPPLVLQWDKMVRKGKDICPLLAR